MRMQFGVFIAPFHPAGQSPTLALERDLDLITYLDDLGYDEAWVGEHHSGGWELIASPELFLAVAGQRTRRIRLGTGVVSLPYHHPMMVADRIVLLDHLTKGRAMLGVGPGALPGDARMLGIDPTTQREKMDEAFGIIIRLLTEDEPITYISDWFELHEAQLQLKPYQRPTMPLAVASTISPAGMTAAGKHGAGILSLATYSQEGLAAITTQWNYAVEAAEKAGKPPPSRADWRLVVPFHLAEDKEQAIQEVEEGAFRWYNEYLINIMGAPGRVPVPNGRVLVEGMNSFGGGIVGTPDDAIACINRLQEISGGFGMLLNLGHEWASVEQIKRSYELFARYVMPEFQDTTSWVMRSRDWTLANKESLAAGTVAAITKAITDAGVELPQQQPAAKEA